MSDKDKTTTNSVGKSSKRERRKAPSPRLKTRFLALEPRIVFDGAMAADIVDKTVAATTEHSAAVEAATAPAAAAPDLARVSAGAAPLAADKAVADVQAIRDANLTDPAAQLAALSNPAATAQGPSEILFIDGSLNGVQQLLNGVRADVQVFILDSSKDGFSQITAALAGRLDISTIHLVTHGDPGRVAVGNDAITVQSLEEHSAEVAGWRASLSAGADFLIYGCDVGQGILGQTLLNELSSRIGADSAASDNLTGAGPMGGDWNLEVSHGAISSRPFADPAVLDVFNGLLAKPVLDLNGPTVLTVTDNFSTGTYTGGSSTLTTTWTSAWTEFDASPTRAFAPTSNSDNSPISGNVIIPGVATGGTVSGLGTGQEIAFVGHSSQYGDSIARAVNLKAYTAAILSFSYRTAGLGASDVIEVDVSNNDGANFTTVAVLANVTSNTTASFDISNYISETTTIRLAVKSGFATASSQQFFFDNVSITADGNNFVTNYSEQVATPVKILDSAATITDTDTGQLLKGATVALTNMKAGDSFAVGSLPTGITVSVDNVNGIVTLSSASGDTAANFVTALRSITFSNSSNIPDTTLRNIAITVTDAGNETSITSNAFIHITPYDNPVTAVSHSVATSSLGTTSGTLFDNSSLTAQRAVSTTLDYDCDTVGLSTALLTQAAKGTAVVNADGTYTYTPNAGASGTDSFTYALTSKAQVIGVNYQYWSNSTITSLATGFPTTSPDKSNYISGFDVDGVALDTVGGTKTANTSLDNFVIRFTNSITITTGGTYTFTSGSDDGSMVYIDTTGSGTFTTVVNNDGLHSYQEASGSITLAPGTYSLRVDFCERGGQEDLKVWYQGADTGGLKTNLSDVGQVLANSTTTGTVSITLQDGGPRLALGASTYALDNFSSNSYSVNVGSFSYAGAWAETNDGGSPTGGDIRVSGGVLRVADTDTSGSTQKYIQRSVDLLGVTSGSATRVGTQLSFNYSSAGASSGINVQISADGGTSWTTLDTIAPTGATASALKTYDISNYASNTAVIRFIAANPTNVARIDFDNVRIDASTVNYNAGTYIENGAGVAIASGPVSGLGGTVIADPNASSISGATITLSNAQSGDILSYDNFVSGIAASFSSGTLTLTGTATRAQYATALQHVFFSSTSENPSTVSRNINVSVTDSSSLVSNTAVATVAVQGINDTPSGIDASVTTALNTAFVLRTSDFAFTDIEGNALLAVNISALPSSVGVLQFDTTGTGSWSTVTVNQTISAANIAAGRLRLLPNAGTSGSAVFQFQIQDSGGTASGGVDLDPTPNSFTVKVLPGANTAPTLSSGLTLVASLEDAATPTPRTISQVLTDTGVGIFVDPDSGSSLTGLAVIGNTANSVTQGKWQYSVDGTTWTDVGTVGNTATTALALSASTQVRFLAVTDYNGVPPALSMRALDDTYSGSFTSVSTRTFVGATPFASSAISTASYALGTTVTAVNDAPVLAAGNPALTTIGASQIGNAGQLVSDFVMGTAGSNRTVVTDVDTGAVLGIAVVGAGGSSGTWQCSTDNGATWNTVGSVSTTSGLLLRSIDKIRFNPDGTSSGSGVLTYRAWDQTVGTFGSKVDTSVFGGISTFSTNTDTATISVTAPTGPVLSVSSVVSFQEGAATPATINASIAVADGRSANLTGATVVIGNYVSGQDVLSFTNVGSVVGSWNASTGTVTFTGTDTLANYQTALRSVKFSNTSDAPDTNTRSINYQISDATGASNVLSASVSVSPVNDMPTLAGSAQVLAYVENQAATVIDSAITVTDVDSPANFNAGHLQVVLGTSLSQDQLSILTSGTGATLLTASGSNVTYGGVVIGTIDTTLNGVNGQGLKIALNFNSSPAAVQALARSIGYANNSDAPNTTTRTVTFTLNDGGNIGSGGALAGVKSTDTITVASVPEVATISSIVESTGGGISAAEAASGGGTPVVVGLPVDAVAGDTVTVNWGGQTVAYTLTSTDITNGNASVIVPSATISTRGDGTFNVTATVSRLGQSGALSAPFSVTVDTVVASPTVGLGTDSGSSGSDKITNVGTLTVSGTEAGATVQYSSDGTTWSASAPALTQGTNTVYVRQTDVAGNVSAGSTAYTFTYDTVAPSETISSTIGTDTGSTTTITSGGLTKDNTLALSGTVSDVNGLSSVQIYDGATLLGSATVVSGNWTFTTGALADGSHTLTAKAMDVAGNTFTTAGVIATIDTTATSATPVVLNPQTTITPVPASQTVVPSLGSPIGSGVASPIVTGIRLDVGTNSVPPRSIDPSLQLQPVDITGGLKGTPLPASQTTTSSNAQATSADELNALPPTASGPPQEQPQLTSIETGFPLARVAQAESGTNTTGQALSPNEQRLFVYEDVINGNGNGQFQVPADAFAHTDPAAVVILEARQVTGEPLPTWLQFNAVTGQFQGLPPVGTSAAIDVEVIARDSDGREASVAFKLDLGAAPNTTGQNGTLPQNAFTAASTGGSQADTGGPGNSGAPFGLGVGASGAMGLLNAAGLGSSGGSGVDSVNALPGTSAGVPRSGSTDIASTDAGFPVARVPQDAIASASAGGSADPVEGRLFVFGGVVDGRGVDSFQVPREAFAHTDPSAVVKLEANQVDGLPLPPWLQFNGVTGQFQGTPPAGVSGALELEITAKDADGREASLTFKLQLGLPASELPQPASLPAKPADGTRSEFMGAAASDFLGTDANGVGGVVGPRIATSLLGADTNVPIRDESTAPGTTDIRSDFRDSAVPPESKGFPVVRLSESSADLMPVSISDIQARLFVYQGIKDAIGFDQFQVPRDVFAHTDTGAVVKLELRSATGEALPSWLEFDSFTGMFRGLPPGGGGISLELILTAQDSEGREASVEFKLDLGVKEGSSKAIRAEWADSELILGSDDLDADVGRDKAQRLADVREAKLLKEKGLKVEKHGAKSFAEQIRAAKSTKDPVLTNILVAKIK